MAFRHPGLSRTLPKDFVYYPEPKTPKRPVEEPTIPPPPHHSSCRFRRPRVNFWSNPFDTSSDSRRPDIPLPSIELPQDPVAASQLFQMSLPGARSDQNLQVPPRERLNPKTPPAQIRHIPLETVSDWTDGNVADLGASIQRPASACSNISDSSVSSCSSFASHPSYGGSCTSPESEIQDPFISYPSNARKEQLETPSKRVNTRKILPRHLRVHWTSEMDTHLWNTYQMYLQDPTITPFKMVPGSLPPLGVSHRVARQAKKTWPRAKRLSSVQGGRGKSPQIVLQQEDQNGTEDSVLLSAGGSGSSTPTAKVTPQPTWPRSEASTRRRLKNLCKRKFSIAPHYQRLIQSRSPSPFLEPPPMCHNTTMATRPESSYTTATSFATRDLGISLASSSMPNNTYLEVPRENDSFNVQDNWFNNIGAPRPSTSQGITTIASASSTNTASASANHVPRLGSPFMYHTWGPSTSRNLRPSTPVNQSTSHSTSMRFRSPPRRNSFSNKQKRRALHQLEDEISPSGSDLRNTLPSNWRDGKGKDSGQRRVRLRNRGATIGTSSARERLDQLFTPPAASGSVESASGVQSSSPRLPNNDQLKPPEDIKRLGSPFRSDIWKNKPVRANRHSFSISETLLSRPIADQIPSSIGLQPESYSRQSQQEITPNSLEDERVRITGAFDRQLPNTPTS